MSEWTPRYRLAIPADPELVAIGNQVAAIFDPDTGGAQTFTDANRIQTAMGDYHLIQTQLVAGYDMMLRSPRAPQLWYGMLSEMAQARGRPMPSVDEIVAVCDAVLFDDECDALTEPPN
jgi:hypothetical protein